MAKDVDEGAEGVGGREGPVWVEQFLSHGYFGICNKHTGGKGERNHFCLDCIEGPLCSVGLRSHAGHSTLQTRKASYKDAVRVADVQRYLDVRDIMIYSINGSKIVFLHRRPQANPPKMHPRCEMCKRTFAEPMRFCSLQCKLDGIRSKPHEPDLTFSIGEAGGSVIPGAGAAQPVVKKKVTPGDTCSEGSRKDGSLGSTIRQGGRVQARKQVDAKKSERDRELDGLLEQLSPVARKRRMQDLKEEDTSSDVKQETEYSGPPELVQPELLVRKRRKAVKELQGVNDARKGRKSDAAELATSSVNGCGKENQVGGMGRSNQLLQALDILASTKTFPGLTIVCSPTSVLPIQSWQGGLSHIASPTSPQAGASSTPVSPPSGSPVRSPVRSSTRSLSRSPVGSPNRRNLRGTGKGMERPLTERRHSRKGVPHRAPLM